MDGSNGMPSSAAQIKPFNYQNLSSKENEGVKGIETMLTVEVAGDDKVEVSEAETNQINQNPNQCSAKLSEYEEEPPSIDLAANLCPLCKVRVFDNMAYDKI